MAFLLDRFQAFFMNASSDEASLEANIPDFRQESEEVLLQPSTSPS